MKSLALAALALVVAAGPALADRGHAASKAPRGKRAKVIDVAGAVASGDAARQCDAAIALVGAGQHARASFLIGTCATVTARADAARAARIAISKRAERDGWSPVELDVPGAGADVTIAIDAFADVTLAPGRWKLPPGTYQIVARGPGGEATHTLALDANSRALVQLVLPTAPVAGPAVAGVVDFGKDESTPLDRPIAGPPPAAKHESLLPERYRKGLKQCGAMACRRVP